MIIDSSFEESEPKMTEVELSEYYYSYRMKFDWKGFL